MVSRLEDAGAVTCGRGPADEPSASALPRPAFQEQPSETPAAFGVAKLQMRDTIIPALHSDLAP